MSNRKTLAKSDLPDDIKAKLVAIKDTKAVEFAEIFKKFGSRRSTFNLENLGFYPNLTEYTLNNFFNNTLLFGDLIRIPKENKAEFKALVRIGELFTEVGIPVSKESILESMKSVHTTKVADGNFIEIVPNFIYGYLTASRPNDLIIRTEYFFGWIIKDTLDLMKKERKLKKKSS